jgi:cytochrome c-type biogenesis protein CcmE
MGKLNNKKAFIIFGAAAVCISLAYWLSLLAQGKTVQAFVTPMETIQITQLGSLEENHE